MILSSHMMSLITLFLHVYMCSWHAHADILIAIYAGEYGIAVDEAYCRSGYCTEAHLYGMRYISRDMSSIYYY